jgi:multicomponent Na+:H+ antiporter subunit A
VDGLVAVGTGVVIAALCMAVTDGTIDRQLTAFFEHNSYIAAHGRNIVNVILVDFRGLDTLGEITVVATAGLAGYALITKRKAVRESVKSYILKAATRLAGRTHSGLFRVSAVSRGHNAPGGGFSAALVAATAFRSVCHCRRSPSGPVYQALRIEPTGVDRLGAYCYPPVPACLPL